MAGRDVTLYSDTGQVLKYDRTIGIVAMEGRGFSNPVDIAFSSDDRIYVVSRTNSLQPYGIRIGICDLESNYYGHFGSNTAQSRGSSCGRHPCRSTRMTTCTSSMSTTIG